MTSFRNDPAGCSYSDGIQPAHTSFADDVCATIARIFAYVGTLALFGIFAVHVWNQYHAIRLAGLAAKAGWSLADRSHPAFSVSQSDPLDKSETYLILRHPGGGRKDILRWLGAGDRPAAELEIYRPSGEPDTSSPTDADLAARMPQIDMLQIDAAELEAAGIIESKFGTVALLRRTDAKEGAGGCLGFLKRLDAPPLQISGWSCEGDRWPARRAAIGCMLDRLTLLAFGNETKLTELFARAELKRGNCGTASPSDWVTGVEDPKLRGTL
jgi:hypothetical protein